MRMSHRILLAIALLAVFLPLWLRGPREPLPFALVGIGLGMVVTQVGFRGDPRKIVGGQDTLQRLSFVIGLVLAGFGILGACLT
jgi:hypothetical protein